MYIRRILSVILISALLAGTAVSCSTGSGSEKAVADQSDNLKSGSSKELTMYVASFDTTTQNAVKKFNESHKNVQIKTKSVSSLSQKDLGGKLMYEFNNGGGPDIILCGYESLPNLSVYFEKGAFYDLNTLIGNDKTFDKTKCFEKVLDFGIYKAKRYVIPLSFKIDAMFSTKAIIEKNGIETGNSGMDIGTFSSAAQKYMTNAGGNAENQKYFISGLDFSSLLQTSASPFFDIEKKTAVFDSKEFGDLLEKYKGLAECAATKTLSVTDSQSSDLLASEKVVFQNSGTMTPRYAFLPYRSFKSEVEPVLLPSVSSDTSRHIIAKPEKYMGINAKCGNLKAAYDFIKLMLSVEFQDSDITEGIPVNRDAYKQAVDNSLKGMKGYDMWRDGGCCTKKALMQLYSQLDALVKGIDRCWTTDEYVLTVVENEVDSYLAGNAKKEDTLKNIQKKVADYFKSGIILEAAADKDETPVDPDKVITMYYWNSGDFPNHSVSEFEEQNPGYKVKMKILDSSEYFTRTAVELMAGGGPDIILFHMRTFKSITKVIDTGAFCEMDEYIKKYNIINFNEYNRSLLDGGIYKGKRYYIPVYYYGFKLFTTDKLLEENNLSLDQGWTWDKFVECSKEFMSKYKNQDKYFLESNYGLSYIIANWEEPLIDYENKKSYFNSASFKKLLKIYKELRPSIAPEGSKYELMMKNKKYLFVAGLDSPLTYKYDYEDCKSWGLGNIMLVQTPSFTGKHIENAIFSQGIAVNSKCKNKEAAFKFIKNAISYNMQRYYYKNGEVNGNLSIPISRSAFADDLKSYMNSAASLPESIVNQALQTHSITKSSQIRDYSLIDMIDGIAKDYYNGSKSVDQVAKEIDDKVNVFLNE